MNYHFKLCEDCGKEIVIEGKQKLDFSYKQREPSPHICSASETNHPENGINLMQNART